MTRAPLTLAGVPLLPAKPPRSRTRDRAHQRGDIGSFLNLGRNKMQRKLKWTMENTKC